MPQLSKEQSRNKASQKMDRKYAKKNPLEGIKGMSIPRFHTSENQSVYEQVKYQNRSAKITNPDGTVVFAMENLEVPEGWSQLAVDIAVSKYFRKAGVPKTGHEISIKQLVYRVAHTIRTYGEENGYFATAEDAESFENEMTYLLLTQRGAFNSPVWFNCGLHHEYGIKGSGGNYYWDPVDDKIKLTDNSYAHPQCSACFIQRVEDDLMSIFDLCKKEARIFKFGSGTGTNFSKIRGGNEKLSGGGCSSGLMSFLTVLDRGAGATKSGGTTRRAAKMVCLDADHPEIMDFVEWKSSEENKVQALVDAGYPSDFNGEAYRTVSGQNSNNSVRVTDEFMNAVEKDGDWETTCRTTGEVADKFKARELFDRICKAAWKCADPGLQYDSTINKWHTCSNTEKIFASNPCSEYMFLDDTACNLASINLMKYLDEEGNFDIEGFQHACSLFVLAQEIVVDLASYPTEQIAANSHNYRTLGLGYANLGALLMVDGIPYDSDEGRATAAAITAIMQGEAYKTSSKVAAFRGAFGGYEENKEPMLNVIKGHLECAEDISSAAPSYLKQAAIDGLADAHKLGKLYGYRNAQVSVLAPTGTIGLLMDCDTTGIEPDFALVKFKKLAGGGYFKIVNSSVPRALKKLGYSQKESDEIIEYAIGTQSLDKVPHISKTELVKRGFTTQDIKNLQNSCQSAFNIEGVFQTGALSLTTLDKLGVTPEMAKNPSFNLLKHMGLSAVQIEEAEEALCGTMSLEGAPHLKTEHLPVFDCANACGNKGTRFLSPISHLKMMAAVQPFISGAISKTVNLPNDATVEDIKDLYLKAWKMGIKAVALYRDGCKLSQPLSSKTEEKEAAQMMDVSKMDLSQLERDDVKTLMTKVLDRMEQLKMKPNIMRHRLPKKRNGFTVEAKVGGHKVYLRTGEYGNGKLGEIFLDMHKEGASFRALLNCFAIAVSKGLQHGVPLDEFVDVLTFTRFEPHGMVEHENIKTATSVVDFIFRVLGMEYLGRTDFVHVKPGQEELRFFQQTMEMKPKVNQPESQPVAEAVSKIAQAETGESASQGLYDTLMGDAPPCADCGHTTVRNGSCYRCLNCGNSMGCS